MFLFFYKREVCAQPRSQPWTISSLLLCAPKKQVLEPTSDKPKSSSTTVGALKSKSRKCAKSKDVGKSKHKKDIKKHKKSSKRKKKKSSHSSFQADPSPISSSELLEGSCTVSLNLGDPMQFHRPLPFGKACAKMLVRARFRCECHFLLLSQCPSRR